MSPGATCATDGAAGRQTSSGQARSGQRRSGRVLCMVRRGAGTVMLRAQRGAVNTLEVASATAAAVDLEPFRRGVARRHLGAVEQLLLLREHLLLLRVGR